MKRLAAAILILGLGLAGCREQQAAELPPPQRMTAEAVGNYCGMNVLEHPGPKGQIVFASVLGAVWFSSVRDTLAFTMLPEEPKNYQAIYVSDMGKAPSWDKPGEDNWVEARQAVYVLDSRLKGGMGAAEAVPFSDRGAAERFAAENGGRVVGFNDIPQDYVLGPDGLPPGATAAGEAETGAAPQM
jgi:copper chaperone NosL